MAHLSDRDRLSTLRRRGALVGAAVCLAAVALVVPRDAVAQTATPSSTTTAPPTTVLPTGSTTSTTSTTAPPQSAPQPASGQPADNEAGPESVPQDHVVAPAATTGPDPATPLLQQLAQVTLAEMQKTFRAAQKDQAGAADKLNTLTTEVTDLEQRLAKLEAEKAQAVARLQTARVVLRNRAVAGYMGSPAAPLNQVLESSDFNDLSRRFELFRAVIEADRHRIDEYNRARIEVGQALESVVSQLDEKRAAKLVALTTLDGADSSLLAKQIQLASVQAGGNVVGSGFIFPVGGPHSFRDDFGEPRMFGTAYAHLHQGTDVFAASGTPLLACERGVLVRIGTDLLGGTKLWLVGASNTRYYYAHLSAFAPGVAEGKAVQAGDVVGYVGNTGNAATTPSHLHFEVHPDGGPAVNPYPLLKIVDEAQARFRSGSGGAPSTSARS